jgi:hypothetical protein
MQELQELSKNLAKAKKVDEIREIEGKLIALEEKMDFLNPSGPTVRYVHPKNAYVDPDSIEEDLSDARWIATADFLPTSYIQAVFGEKDQNGDFKSVYKPTHVLKIGGKTGDMAMDEMVNNFSLLDKSQGEHSFQSFGFPDDETFHRAQRTKVWYVRSKVTRQVLMFNDEDWAWPIWVWDDPLKLDTFYNLFPLSFYIDPEGGETKGEVTYYLDQQDAINEINSEIRSARQKARYRGIYNKSIIEESEINAMMRQEDDTLTGVDAPPDIDLSKAMAPAPAPSLQMPELFDINSKLQAISRISSGS